MHASNRTVALRGHSPSHTQLDDSGLNGLSIYVIVFSSGAKTTDASQLSRQAESQQQQQQKLLGKAMPRPCRQTPLVSVPTYHWLTRAQTQTLSINVLLHPSYNNMHKQIQSELKSLPEHCPPYGTRNKKLTFNFHSCTFISIHEYANPTVPVAITMRAPTGRCQRCQGRKKPTPFRLLGQWACVCGWVHECVCA